MKLLTSELTSDEDVGQSPRFYVIKCQVCIQTSEYCTYDPERSNLCGVCRCVSYRTVLSTKQVTFQDDSELYPLQNTG